LGRASLARRRGRGLGLFCEGRGVSMWGYGDFLFFLQDPLEYSSDFALIFLCGYIEDRDC